MKREAAGFKEEEPEREEDVTQGREWRRRIKKRGGAIETKIQRESGSFERKERNSNEKTKELRTQEAKTTEFMDQLQKNKEFRRKEAKNSLKEDKHFEFLEFKGQNERESESVSEEFSIILGSMKKESLASFFSNEENCLIGLDQETEPNEKRQEDTGEFRRKHRKPESSSKEIERRPILPKHEETGKHFGLEQNERIKGECYDLKIKEKNEEESDPVVRYLEQKNLRLVSENQTLKRQLRESQWSLNEAEKKLREMQRTLDTAIAEKNKETGQILDERDFLLREKLKMKETIEKNEELARKLESDFNVRVGIIEEDKKQMRKKIESLKERNANQESEIGSLKSKVEELSSGLSSKDALYRALKSELLVLREEVNHFYILYRNKDLAE